ncbi:hypothetical protein LSH36_209g01027, partial [Paralvinella palmiformis]
FLNCFESMAAKYQKLENIGKGAFGSAWLVLRRHTDRRYVLKEVPVRGMSTKAKKQALTEVKALSRCRHVNVIRYREAFVDSAALCIIMEYADGGHFGLDYTDLFCTQKYSQFEYYPQRFENAEYFSDVIWSYKGRRSRHCAYSERQRRSCGHCHWYSLLFESRNLQQTTVSFLYMTNGGSIIPSVSGKRSLSTPRAEGPSNALRAKRTKSAQVEPGNIPRKNKKVHKPDNDQENLVMAPNLKQQQANIIHEPPLVVQVSQLLQAFCPDPDVASNKQETVRRFLQTQLGTAQFCAIYDGIKQYLENISTDETVAACLPLIIQLLKWDHCTNYQAIE